jgi:aminopeptidase N
VNQELLFMAAHTRSAEEKRMYLRALSATLDPELARNTLQYLLPDNVKPGDLLMALANFSGEGEHPDIAWSFAIEHLKEIQERFGTLGRNRLLASIATGFTDDNRADEVSTAVQANLPATTIREVENSIKEIRFRSKLKAKILPAIDAWIKAKHEGSQENVSRDP